MIRILIVGILLSISIHGCSANAEQKENSVGEVPSAEAKSEGVPEQLIVVFIKGTSEERINEINKSLNVKVLDESFGFIYLIEIPNLKSEEKLRKEYGSFPEVEAVNLNFGVHPQK